MKYSLTLLILAILLVACESNKEESMTQTIKDLQAPIAQKKDSVLETHGHVRKDPYFWMRLKDDQKVAESPDAQTKQTLEYLESENQYTKQVLAHTEDMQATLYDEIVGRIKQTDESVPYFKNGYWYYSRYNEGKEYPIYCRKEASLDEQEKVMLDVNKLAKSHDYYNVAGLKISPNNKILAFAEDTVSRRVYTYRFLNLETGELLNDIIENVDPGSAWAKDNKTFFYTSKNEISLLSEKIWRHQLGSDQSKDALVYHEKDPSFYIDVHNSKSGDYIIIDNNSTTISDYHILDASAPLSEFKQFIPRGSSHEYFIEHFEDKWYILTNSEATNSIQSTSQNNWKEVIPHREDVLLSDIDVFKNHLVISERSNALTHIRIINQKSGLDQYINFDEEAYVVSTSVNPEFNTDKLRFVYSSLTTPISTIDIDLNSQKQEIKKQEEVIGGHNPTDYITKRLWATGRDGTKIPISIVYHKSTVPSSNTPLLQYAYGSYGSSTNPTFRSSRLSLLNRGFIYAIAHIRGGQEMGRQWYEDGKMFKKKNTFYDFIDCSKHLISESYTSSDHLYAMGGSAGGLLMGAVVNMAPDLYNGIIAAVPFVDVVSTMLDESIPLTTNEFDEWGNPKNKDSYDYMLSYSPYDQIKEQDYPNMLITTGLFDSQVQYWEPAKWIAKLRDKKTDNNILMMHTNMEAGHGGASGRFKRHKQTALQFAFFMDLEGLSDVELKG
jgi:oligopeptidase B